MGACMKTFNSDFAYRAAAKARSKAMDRDNLRHVLSEGIAYAVVVVVSAVTFALAVMEVGR